MNDENISSTICPVCETPGVLPFLHFKQIPIHCNLLWPTPEAAQGAPRGDISLGFCAHCGYISNLCFDAGLTQHGRRYDRALYFSPCFQQYANSLARKLVERYELTGKDAIEIGSGKGEFLAMLCKLGANRGTGFDPDYTPPARRPVKGVTFIQDSFSERYAHYRADIICCRFFLERVPQPANFMAQIRRAIGSRQTTAVFFEVPNVLFTLRQVAIWDFSYEHYSYFSPRSLVHLFSRAGFSLVALEESFGGRFLTIEALPEANGLGLINDDDEEQDRLVEGLEAFAGQYWQKIAIWQQRLQRMAARKQRAVVWGTGRRVGTFLNALQAGNSLIKYAVDENPARIDQYVAGTAQRIVPPEFLKEYRPQTIIALNSNQRNQIRQQCRALGLTPLIMIA
jgi:hypothetical protein